jgi:hypothetical protein
MSSNLGMKIIVFQSLAIGAYIDHGVVDIEDAKR